MKTKRLVLVRLLLIVACLLGGSGNQGVHEQLSCGVTLHVPPVAPSQLSSLDVNHGPAGYSSQSECPVRIFKPIRPKALQGTCALVAAPIFELPFLTHHCPKEYTLFFEQIVPSAAHRSQALRGPPALYCCCA